MKQIVITFSQLSSSSKISDIIREWIPINNPENKKAKILLIFFLRIEAKQLFGSFFFNLSKKVNDKFLYKVDEKILKYSNDDNISFVIYRDVIINNIEATLFYWNVCNFGVHKNPILRRYIFSPKSDGT